MNSCLMYKKCLFLVFLLCAIIQIMAMEVNHAIGTYGIAQIQSIEKYVVQNGLEFRAALSCNEMVIAYRYTSGPMEGQVRTMYYTKHGDCWRPGAWTYYLLAHLYEENY